jgi:hypothetical protein
MANRVKLMMGTIMQIQAQIKGMFGGTRRRALETQLERYKRDLMFFGSRYHLVEITITYYPLEKIGANEFANTYGNQRSEKIYLTDCTTEEAHTWVYDFRYRNHKIIQCQILRIHLSNPIKIESNGKTIEPSESVHQDLHNEQPQRIEEKST